MSLGIVPGGLRRGSFVTGQSIIGLGGLQKDPLLLKVDLQDVQVRFNIVANLEALIFLGLDLFAIFQPLNIGLWFACGMGNGFKRFNDYSLQ